MKRTIQFYATAAIISAATLQAQPVTWDPVLDITAHPAGVDLLSIPGSQRLFLASNSSGQELTKILMVDPTVDPAQATELARWTGQIQSLGYVPTSGTLWEVGDVWIGTSRAWQTQTSTDGGVTWTAAGPNYQLIAGLNASATGVAFDNAGNVVVSGRANSKSGSIGNQYWIVRRRDQNGIWTTPVAQTKSGVEVAADVHFVPPQNVQNAGGIFAVGRMNFSWTVQRSRDGGSTWMTVDSFLPSKSGDAGAFAVTSDGNGNIYVGGSGRAKLNTAQSWYVRMSSNGGDTWQTILANYQVGESWINKLAFDRANNNLWAVGVVNAPSSAQRWTMMRYNPATGWSAPAAPYPQNESNALGTAADDFGNVYVTGGYADTRGHLSLLQVQ